MQTTTSTMTTIRITRRDPPKLPLPGGRRVARSTAPGRCVRFVRLVFVRVVLHDPTRLDAAARRQVRAVEHKAESDQEEEPFQPPVLVVTVDEPNGRNDDQKPSPAVPPQVPLHRDIIRHRRSSG